MDRIEEKYGVKKGQAIALAVILVLNVLWIVCSTFDRIKRNGTLPIYHIVDIIMFAVTVYYVCYSYKKPHGNLMRYLILCFAALQAFQYINTSFTYPIYAYYAFYAGTILKGYMAGRLDHYKQNMYISTIILACECLARYALLEIYLSAGIQVSFVIFMEIIGPVTLWLAISTSYFIRFKPHKQAGLENK